VVNRLRSVSAERSDIATLDITERREAAGQVLDVVLVGVSPSPLGAIFVLGRPALGGFTGHIVLKRTFELRPDPGQRERFQLGNVAGLCLQPTLGRFGTRHGLAGVRLCCVQLAFGDSASRSAAAAAAS
jgi:hypothetical protein